MCSEQELLNFSPLWPCGVVVGIALFLVIAYIVTFVFFDKDFD